MWFASAFAILLVSTALTWLGCDSSDDDFDHDPPDGKGTLYVDNHTGDDLNVFIDGIEVKGVDGNDYEYYDLDPGEHRLVINTDKSWRRWSGDVDVLLGKRSIAEVSLDLSDTYAYDVFVYFD